MQRRHGFNPIIGSIGLVGVAVNGTLVILASLRSNPRARAGDRDAMVEEVIGIGRCRTISGRWHRPLLPARPVRREIRGAHRRFRHVGEQAAFGSFCQATADSAGLTEIELMTPHHGRMMPTAIWYPGRVGA